MCKHLSVIQIHIYNFKTFKFLKITTYFGKYGHPKELKSSGGTAAILLLLHVSLRCARVLCSFLYSLPVSWICRTDKCLHKDGELIVIVWYDIAKSESEILLPCQCGIPRFEIKYGICLCNARLDSVYFIQHILLRGTNEQTVCISRLQNATFSGQP
jgi:hypothetical protein